jgi:hypothetical protein
VKATRRAKGSLAIDDVADRLWNASGVTLTFASPV